MNSKICVIIPAYRVSGQILEVVRTIPEFVEEIIVVDDCCPENSGALVSRDVPDQRVKVINHEKNIGVGGAVASGYARGIKGECDIFVKLDGDGQMNPANLSELVDPIFRGRADYTKGNRFSTLANVREMPPLRIFGNLVLSIFSRFSTGYWDIFDFNNGYTAISRDALTRIPMHKLHKKYFFESDILYHLYINRNVVVDIPMQSHYGSEKSSLSVIKTAITFPILHLRNFLRRVTNTYLVTDFSIASLQLIFGSLFTIFGLIYGLANFYHSATLNRNTPTGTLVLVAISILSGLQLSTSFLTYDLTNIPRRDKGSK